MTIFKKSFPYKVPFIIPGMASLIAGLWAALGKLEWVGGGGFSSFPSLHGALMVSGFLGTVISLERSVVLGSSWGYCAPLSCGLGAMALMVGLPVKIGITLFLTGSILFLFLSLALAKRQWNLATGILTGSSVFWITGNLFWLAGEWHFRVVLWWMGFLLFIITGERFELAHFVLQSKSRLRQLWIYGGMAAFLAGACGVSLDYEMFYRIAGIGIVLISTWLMVHDMPRRNLYQTGLTRFTAICLMGGYAWLMISGLLIAFFVPTVSGTMYDASLHSFFLGFVIFMIFGHAPIIFPSITGVSIPYHPRFYTHVVFLDASLFLRIVSDFLSWEPGIRWGGLLNVISILMFLANTVSSALLAKRSREDNT